MGNKNVNYYKLSKAPNFIEGRQSLTFSGNNVIADAQAKLAPYGPTERTQRLTMAKDAEKAARIAKIMEASRQEVAKSKQELEMSKRTATVDSIMNAASSKVESERLHNAVEKLELTEIDAAKSVSDGLRGKTSSFSRLYPLNKYSKKKFSMNPFVDNSNFTQQIQYGRKFAIPDTVAATLGVLAGSGITKATSLITKSPVGKFGNIVGAITGGILGSMATRKFLPDKASTFKTSSIPKPFSNKTDFSLVGFGGEEGLRNVLLEERGPSKTRRAAFGMLGIGSGVGAGLLARKLGAGKGRLLAGILGAGMGGLAMAYAPRNVDAVDSSTGDKVTGQDKAIAVRIAKRLKAGNFEGNVRYGGISDLEGTGGLGNEDPYGAFAVDLDEAMVESPATLHHLGLK